jgi:UDP-glucose 4-epimerase
MRFLVTGGGGFIGQELVKHLLSKEYEVFVLDKVVEPIESIKDPHLTVVRGDVSDREVVGQLVKDVDVIYYSAWSFAERAEDAFNIDVGGYINVLDAAVKYRVKHFLFPDSSVIYGEPIRTPIDEEHPLLVEKSRSPLHALTKFAAEKLSELYYQKKKLPYTIFRFWWAFSDQRVPGGTLRKIIDSALKGETIKIPIGTGGSVVYTGDVAKAFELATLNEKAYGQVFNLSSFYMKWQELVEIIVRLANSLSKIELVAPEYWAGPGFLLGEWRLEIGKIKKLVGFKVDETDRHRLFEKSLLKTINARREVPKQK